MLGWYKSAPLGLPRARRWGTRSSAETPTEAHDDNRLIVTEGGDGQKSDAPAVLDAKINLHSASPAYVEVAHEALIRSWSRLRKWIDADRSGLRTHRRLTEAAKEWEDKRRHPEFLYSSGRLAIAREWASNHWDQLTKIKDEFLAASRKEEERAVRARKSTKAVLTALVIALLAIPLGGISTWVWIQYHTYTAEIGGKVRPDELVITRQLKYGAPLMVSTGFTRDLLLAGGVTNFGFAVPNATADWGTLENHLHPFAKARLQFATRLDGIAGANDEALAKLAASVSWEAVTHPDISLFAAVDPNVFDYAFAMLHIGDPFSKSTAAAALGRLGEQLPGARVGAVTDALLAAFKDSDFVVASTAAAALGRLGKRIDSVRRPGCIRALVLTARQPARETRFPDSGDKLPNACHASLRKLTAVDSAPETGVLLENLAHLDSRERLLAIFTLSRRVLAPAELEQIRRLRNDPEHRPWVRMAALETLVEIAREAEAVARDKEEAAKAAEKEKQKKARAKPTPPR